MSTKKTTKPAPKKSNLPNPVKHWETGDTCPNVKLPAHMFATYVKDELRLFPILNGDYKDGRPLDENIGECILMLKGTNKSNVSRLVSILSELYDLGTKPEKKDSVVDRLNSIVKKYNSSERSDAQRQKYIEEILALTLPLAGINDKIETELVYETSAKKAPVKPTKKLSFSDRLDMLEARVSDNEEDIEALYEAVEGDLYHVGEITPDNFLKAMKNTAAKAIKQTAKKVHKK